MSPNQEPAPPSPKYKIPPPWYELHTSTDGRLFVPLPPRPALPPIFLTPLLVTDAPAIQEILSLPAINDRLIAVPKPYSLADATAWITLQLSLSASGSGPGPGPGPSPDPDPRSAAVLPLHALRAGKPDSGRFIGAVTLRRPSTRGRGTTDLETGTATVETGAEQRGADLELELGYYLHPDFQGCGIMRDAVRAVLTWAALEHGVTTVVAAVAVGNAASRGVVQALDGFELLNGMDEVVPWPESKGGGMKSMQRWRWRWRGGAGRGLVEGWNR